MSRFDAFAKSVAAGRGLLGSWRSTRPDAAADASRRDLLKRAGLVSGAAVIGSTVIETVTAPAFAVVSAVCTDPVNNCGGSTCIQPQCTDGGRCVGHSDCVSGFCNRNSCTAFGIPDGSPCANGSGIQKDASCASGYCDSSGRCGQPTASANGQPCHGAHQFAADADCSGGDRFVFSFCDRWNPATGMGTCSPTRTNTENYCIGLTSAEKDDSCPPGWCNGGGTCGGSPDCGIPPGSPCHGSTKAIADYTCYEGYSCTGYGPEKVGTCG